MLEWDESKREQVIKEHGIDFKKIADVFDDPFALHKSDHVHSSVEVRYVVIGKTAAYGLVVLIYALDGENIRCITARRAERWMVNEYEKQRRRH